MECAWFFSCSKCDWQLYVVDVKLEKWFRVVCLLRGLIGRSGLLLGVVVVVRQVLLSGCLLMLMFGVLSIRMIVSWMIFRRMFLLVKFEEALCSAGFSEPPHWLKSYRVLSQGQKMRVDIARALLLDKPLIVFDEFTSVVDREIAKVGAFAVSKAVRRSKKRFVAVTCHFDVVDWLEPDWVFNTDSMEFFEKKVASRD